MRYIIAALLLSTIAFIAPRYDAKGDLGLDQIQTDSVKTHPAGTVQGRAWFVEMVF